LRMSGCGRVETTWRSKWTWAVWAVLNRVPLQRTKAVFPLKQITNTGDLSCYSTLLVPRSSALLCVIRFEIEEGREGMREVRKRGMRAVEIEAAEKCGQCRKVPFSLLGGPVYLLQFCSESHVSTSVPS
jgi:hypothetical protein